jgi:prepilin-type processing-associated H-X9-DG protein
MRHRNWSAGLVFDNHKPMKTQKTPSPSTIGPPSRRNSAMTLLEVVAVILVVACLAALLLPGLTGGSHPLQMQCLFNHKQLQIALEMYVDANHGKLAQNIANNIGGGHYATTANQPGSQPGQPYASWVLGDASQPDPGFITNGLIYPYIKDYRIYKCPTDVKTNALHQPTLRSYSMSGWMNGNPAWTSNFVIFKTLSGISHSLSPNMALVFVEENPATINDGYWVQDPTSPNTWMDSPAHHHGGRGSLSFADGHAEFKLWTDKNVLSNAFVGFASDPASGDLAWIQARSTVKAQ